MDGEGEKEEEGQRFEQSCQRHSFLTGETGQADLFGFLLGILKTGGGKRERGRDGCFVCFFFPPRTSFCAPALRA